MRCGAVEGIVTLLNCLRCKHVNNWEITQFCGLSASICASTFGPKLQGTLRTNICVAIKILISLVCFESTLKSCMPLRTRLQYIINTCVYLKSPVSSATQQISLSLLQSAPHLVQASPASQGTPAFLIRLPAAHKPVCHSNGPPKSSS